MTFFDVALVLHGVAVGLAFMTLFGLWGWVLAHPFGLGRYGMAVGALLGPVGIAIEYSVTEPYRHPPVVDPIDRAARARRDDERPGGVRSATRLSTHAVVTQQLGTSVDVPTTRAA